MDDENFTEHLIDLLGYEQAYHFYLVSRGLKPGAMFLDLNRDYKNSIEENCPENMNFTSRNQTYSIPRFSGGWALVSAGGLPASTMSISLQARSGSTNWRKALNPRTERIAA